MKFRLNKNWNPIDDSIQLTKIEIEEQAVNDLVKYERLYFEKYKKKPEWPLDIDNLIKELWATEVIYGTISQENGEELIIGQLDPENKRIIVDQDACDNEHRVSFTLAHEAGHLSLHAGMLVNYKEKQNCLKTDFGKSKKAEISQKRREWQANKYAGAIMAPKHKVFSMLETDSLLVANVFKKPLDLNQYEETLKREFGLSRFTLEIRLPDFCVSLTNLKYINYPGKPPF